MNFGSRSEKVSRRIAQMEADLNRLQKESDSERQKVLFHNNSVQE
ncbi:hypothetical protein [Escherichia coli]